MPLPHRDLASHSHIKGVMDDAVHNGLGDRAVALRVRIDPPVPVLGFELSTENNEKLCCSNFQG